VTSRISLRTSIYSLLISVDTRRKTSKDKSKTEKLPLQKKKRKHNNYILYDARDEINELILSFVATNDDDDDDDDDDL